MKARILGRVWELLHADLGSCKGLCDPPWEAGKRIRIRHDLEPLDELDTVIHECLHASAWKVFDESFVDELATDIASLLWRMGWRKAG